jgi:uncharacterized membrane protein
MRITNKTISRIIAALVMAFLAAIVVHIMDSHDHSLSREAYLANQARDFDDEVAHPKSFFAYLVLGLIGSAMYFGLYEIISLIIGKIFERLKPSDDANA